MWIIWVIKAGAAARPVFLNAACVDGWVMPISAAASSLPSEVNECSTVVLQTPALVRSDAAEGADEKVAHESLHAL